MGHRRTRAEHNYEIGEKSPRNQNIAAAVRNKTNVCKMVSNRDRHNCDRDHDSTVYLPQRYAIQIKGKINCNNFKDGRNGEDSAGAFLSRSRSRPRPWISAGEISWRSKMT